MIGEALKRYREKHGMSVEDLASELGIQVETVKEYERIETDQEAHYMPLPFSDVLKIQALTGCSRIELLSYPAPEDETI